MTRLLDASLTPDGLARLAAGQLNALFCDGESVAPADINEAVEGALPRLEHCFVHIQNKYFFNGTSAVFDHLHGDQYAMWLYFLANELFRRGGSPKLCKKLFLLNKALSGCDAFYEVELPAIFLLVHPLGTVLGRASYADFLVVYQRCGVGSNHGVYPRIGAHATLHPGSSVLGSCKIGADCTIAAESLIMDRDLPDGTLYIGNPRDFTTRPRPPLDLVWRK